MKIRIFKDSYRPAPVNDLLGQYPGGARIAVTLYLRSKSTEGQLARKLKQISSGHCQPLTRKQFARQFGARQADVNRIRKAFAPYEITVSSVDLGRRTVVLQGTAAQFSAAFGTELKYYRHPSGYIYRGREGYLAVPTGNGHSSSRELSSIIVGIFGLDARAPARTHHRVSSASSDPAAIEARPDALYPTDVAKLYRFPTQAQGQGQTIAILELGGGFNKDDIRTYLRKLNLDEALADNVIFQSVDEAQNQPEGPQGADGEVMLDICIALAVAPKSRIVVYFAPNTTQGFLDCITTAAHDNQYKPSVISISWGGPESSWSAQALKAYNQAFQAAGIMGVTVFCASGDDGSNDREEDGKSHCDFPASSPYVVGCGGTNLQGENGNITSETVWNRLPAHGATGGGISDVFPVPDYQQNIKLPPQADQPGQKTGRGVPDVAGDADPATGYIVIVDGQWMVIGGTSAVAPLYAGLFALVNQMLKRPAGFINPFLYQQAASQHFCRDIVFGNNGAYSAGPGWDACTGWGSFIGNKLVPALGLTFGLKDSYVTPVIADLIQYK